MCFFGFAHLRGCSAAMRNVVGHVAGKLHRLRRSHKRAATALDNILPAGYLNEDNRRKVDYKFNVQNCASVSVPYGDHKVISSSGEL